MNIFSKKLDEIINDHSSGSAEILNQCIDILKHHLGKGDLKSLKDKNSLLKNLKRLQESHKNFFIVQHFLKEIMGLLDSDHPNWNKYLSDLIREYELTWNDVNTRINLLAGSSINLINKTILLHSNSSTVKDLFSIRKTDASNIRIIQTESRPNMEGRIQAEFLAGLGYHVTLIADAAIGRYVGIVDMSILGADAIYPGFFVNKCGSLLIALVCHEKGVPLYVLTDSRKLWINQEQSTGIETFHEDIKPGNELWNNPPINILVENYYFESVPNRHVELFITESGKYPGVEI